MEKTNDELGKTVEERSLSSVGTMTEEEIRDALNIPPRDVESYPDIDQNTQLRAGSFLYKLNLLASSADGNLQSLVWDLYSKMDDYIHLDKPNAIYSLLQALEDLKMYVKANDNIIFKDIPSDTTQKKE